MGKAIVVLVQEEKTKHAATPHAALFQLLSPPCCRQGGWVTCEKDLTLSERLHTYTGHIMSLVGASMRRL